MRLHFVLFGTLIAVGIVLGLLPSCSETNTQFDSNTDRNPVEPRAKEQADKESISNPIIGTWRLIPGQPGGIYWPKPCREMKFTKRASYCGDTGSPNSYEVRRDAVTVYDNSFEQIYRFPEQNIMTTSVNGVGTLRFERIN